MVQRIGKGWIMLVLIVGVVIIFGKNFKIPNHPQDQSLKQYRHQAELRITLEPGQVAGLISLSPVVGTTSWGINVESQESQDRDRDIATAEVIYLNGYHEEISSEGPPRWIPRNATWRYSFLVKNTSNKEEVIIVSAMNAAETPRIVNYNNVGDYNL